MKLVLLLLFGVVFAVADALPDRTVAVRDNDGPGGRLRAKVGAFCRREVDLPELYELAALAYGEAKPGWSGGVVRKKVFKNCILNYYMITFQVDTL